MPITIILSNLTTELRLGGTGQENEIATRLLSYATEAISEHLGVNYATTADAIVNEACIRLCSWLYDVPTAGASSRYANALRSSGVERMLLPYTPRSVGLPNAA